jgi:cell division protein FtsW
MTREQALERQARRERRAQKEEESRELARGPIDVPFLLLVLLLTGIGLVVLFSASFPRAYYELGKPTYYLLRQGVFAIMGVAVMFLISRINYQRFRAWASRC